MFHLLSMGFPPAIDCGEAPNVSNASKNANGTTFGAVVTYTCDEGYEVVNGSNTSSCDASKQWRPNTFTCAGKNTVNIYNINLILKQVNIISNISAL